MALTIKRLKEEPERKETDMAQVTMVDPATDARVTVKEKDVGDFEKRGYVREDAEPTADAEPTDVAGRPEDAEPPADDPPADEPTGKKAKK